MRPAHLLENLVRLIYPHACAGCGSEVYNRDALVCWRCIESLPRTGFEKHHENPVYRIFAGRLKVENAMSWLYFSKRTAAQELIHAVKYKGNQALGRQLGQMMGKALLHCTWAADIEAVVPMPLNIRKLRQRGFNQADLLAAGLGEVIGVPVEKVAVMRTKHTATQTRKNRVQRWLNVEHVFDIAENHNLDNKHVLLIDDVITTGATMEACGQVLAALPGVRLSLGSFAFASRL
jgi:ComF family protein